MDFSSRRQKAIQHVKKKLREKLTPDEVLIHAYKTSKDENALDWWLATIFPHLSTKQAKQAVRTDCEDCWDEQGIGANMQPEGWTLLQKACKKEEIDIEALCNQIAPNLTALLGFEKAAELITAAGGVRALSRMTQRDCQRLGNESGEFGGKQQKSIIETHKYATSDRAIRILASRAVLAARIDANNGEFKGDRLHQEVLYAQ